MIKPGPQDMQGIGNKDTHQFENLLRTEAPPKHAPMVAKTMKDPKTIK